MTTRTLERRAPHAAAPVAALAPGPEVTVVIAVWDDYCQLVEQCVASAVAQEAVDVAVIVVDNASQTPLPALDDAVRVVRTPTRLSAGAARNFGLAIVDTPLVLFLDADDTLLPGALARLSMQLRSRPDAVSAVGKHLLWSPVTGAEKVVARAPRPLVRRIARLRRLFSLLTLRFDCYPLVGCAVIRTAVARDAGGFGDASVAEDWMLRSALAFRGRIVFSSEPAVRVRVRSGSLWHRAHSRAELSAMHESFRAHRRADPRLPGWARWLMPLIALAQQRDVRRTTPAGVFAPADHGLIAEEPAAALRQHELSAVVCTHERPEELDGCLRALAEGDAAIQVVVVDSGSSVPCRDVVERYRERIPNLRYMYVPEPGLSRARNAGIAAADGEIVAFLDDDASPEPGWDRALVSPFRAHPEVGCVGGACLPRFAGERPRWLSDRLLQLSSITRFGDRAREPRSSAEWPFGANMAFRRRALDDAGAFSVELGRHGATLLSGEDSDMVQRVLSAGWRVWLEPRAAVLHTVHPERLRSRFYWQRLWWAGVGRAQRPASRLTLRLLLAAPVRLLLWLITRDRIYLYRLAESAGYLAARSRAAARRRLWPVRPVWRVWPVWAAWPAATLVLGALALTLRIHGLHRGLIYPDGYDYLLMARGFANHLSPTLALGRGGELFVPSVDAALKPLFPALVALLSLLTKFRTAADGLTAVSGAATVVLAALLARRLTGSRLAGAVAGVAALACPALAYWSGFTGPDPLAEALALGCALAAVSQRAALAGALGALCASTRPEWLLVLCAVAVAGLAAPDSRELARRALLTGAFVLAGVILLLRPPLAIPAGGVGLLAAALAGGGVLALGATWAAATTRRALLVATCTLTGLAIVARSGLVPASTSLLSDEWPLLALGAVGILRACAGAGRRAALLALAAVVLLGATYAYRNPSSQRYLAQLLPLACVAAGLAAAPLAARAEIRRRRRRSSGPAGRLAIPALRLGIPALLVALIPIVASAPPPPALDTFATLAPGLSRAPSGTLVSAAPDAYGFLLPGRPQRTLSRGARGLILLDGAQRTYFPHLTARGVIVARLDAPHGFERPDGSIDVAPALLVRGVVVTR